MNEETILPYCYDEMEILEGGGLGIGVKLIHFLLSLSGYLPVGYYGNWSWGILTVPVVLFRLFDSLLSPRFPLSYRLTLHPGTSPRNLSLPVYNSFLIPLDLCNI